MKNKTLKKSSASCAQRKLIFLISGSFILIIVCTTGIIVGIIYALKNTPLTNKSTNSTGLPPARYFNTSQSCGMSLVHVSSNQPRIVGGFEAVPYSWSFMVSIGYNGPVRDVKHVCGGSLISDKYVLTAAHCVEENEIFTLVGKPITNVDRYLSLTKMIRIFIGIHNISSNRNTNATYYAKRIVRHELFDSYSLSYDLALIELTQSITQGPICIDSFTDAQIGDYLLVLGWGYLKGKSYRPSDVLMQVYLPIVSEQECLMTYDSLIQFCAGDTLNIKDSCNGDSGGPVLKLNAITKRWTLVGLVSNGDLECLGTGIYTRINYFYNWIITNAI